MHVVQSTRTSIILQADITPLMSVRKAEILKYPTLSIGLSHESNAKKENKNWRAVFKTICFSDSTLC